jgi:hypothetical protein
MSWRAACGRWWDRPLLPYLVLSVSPVVTLVVGQQILMSIPDCGEDESWWELRHFQLALLPALADFLPFLWLASRAPGVRRAAVLAGLLGSARYAILQGATLIYASSSRGQASNEDCTVSVFFAVLELGPAMLIVWFVSALIAAALVRRGRLAAPGP